MILDTRPQRGMYPKADRKHRGGLTQLVTGELESSLRISSAWA